MLSIPWLEVPLTLLGSDGGEGCLRDARAQATAWLAPFPPQPVLKDVAVRVSPARGRRGVRVMRSVFREPTIKMLGGDIMEGEYGAAFGLDLELF